MGYRLRLSRFPKEHFQKYENANAKELHKLCELEYDYETITDLPEQKELLTLQGGVDKDFFKTYCQPFFKKYNPKDYGHDFSIINKDGLLKIIDGYNDEIVEMIDERIKHLESGEHQIELFNLIQKKDRWTMEMAGRKFRPYRLENNILNVDRNLDGAVVTDPSMEYQIFNLAFIYNTFDWDRDFLILSGW